MPQPLQGTAWIMHGFYMDYYAWIMDYAWIMHGLLCMQFPAGVSFSKASGLQHGGVAPARGRAPNSYTIGCICCKCAAYYALYIHIYTNAYVTLYIYI